MKFWEYIAILTILLLILQGYQMPRHGFAQEEEKLGDILEGFEDTQKPEDIRPEVIKDFEDEIPANQNTDVMSGEEILDGFEDHPQRPEEPEAKKSDLPEWLSIDGYLKLSSVYAYLAHDAVGTDTSWHGLTRLRPEIKLELDADLSENWQARISGHAFYDVVYSINGQNNYTSDVLDNYEIELAFDEVYLQGSLTKDFDLKAGRQIVVWGRSDSIRITDVLNPLDLRWPGLVDIEKLRLPVTMTKLDYYVKGWNLSGMALHEVRYNKNPEFGSDFFPKIQPLPGDESPNEGYSIDNTQFAGSITGIFSGWDVSFYLADIYAQNGYLDPTNGVPRPQSRIKHARIQMAGGAFNIVWGNWLIKSEAAFFNGFEFTNTPGREYSRLDALAGTEYSGISDAIITLEIANRHYFDFDNRLEESPDFQKEDFFEWALRITKPYLNDTLKLTFLATLFGRTGEDGGFQRFTVEYDLTDSIKLTGGIVFYQAGDLRRTMGIEDNDRAFFDVQYNF